MSRYSKEAERRTRLHDYVGRTTKQVLSDRDLIGIIAEGEFAQQFGGTPNFELIPAGDDGFDFKTRSGRTIDIKATTRPDGRLMVKTMLKRNMADIYVLGVVSIMTEYCSFKGWATAQDLIEKGEVEEHHGSKFFCLKQNQLRSFRSISERTGRGVEAVEEGHSGDPGKPVPRIRPMPTGFRPEDH